LRIERERIDPRHAHVHVTHGLAALQRIELESAQTDARRLSRGRHARGRRPGFLDEDARLVRMMKEEGVHRVEAERRQGRVQMRLQDGRLENASCPATAALRAVREDTALRHDGRGGVLRQRCKPPPQGLLDVAVVGMGSVYPPHPDACTVPQQPLEDGVAPPQPDGVAGPDAKADGYRTRDRRSTDGR